MLNLRLFLGFSPDDLFHRELEKANPYLVSLLIGKEDYLQEITQNEKRYLGKFLSSYPSLEDMADIENHLLSLLQKLTPAYPFAKGQMQLITHGN